MWDAFCCKNAKVNQDGIRPLINQYGKLFLNSKTKLQNSMYSDILFLLKSYVFKIKKVSLQQNVFSIIRFKKIFLLLSFFLSVFSTLSVIIMYYFGNKSHRWGCSFSFSWVEKDLIQPHIIWTLMDAALNPGSASILELCILEQVPNLEKPQGSPPSKGNCGTFRHDRKCIHYSLVLQHVAALMVQMKGILVGWHGPGWGFGKLGGSSWICSM